jgi:hypothetical protein
LRPNFKISSAEVQGKSTLVATSLCRMALGLSDDVHRTGTLDVALVLLAKGWESPIEEGGGR